MRNPFTRRDANNQFKAKATADLETVTAKLDAARQDLAAIEDEIHSASLSAVLSDDPDAIMAPLRERHHKAQESVTLCEAALEIAQQAQAARVAAAADTAEKANRRARAQHVASLAKVAGKASAGLQQIIEANDEGQRIIAKFKALLRPDELKTMFGHTEPASVWKALIAAEAYRLAPDENGLPLQPIGGSHAIASFKRHGQSWSELPPIEEMARQRFDTSGLHSAPVAPSPAPVLSDGSAIVAEPLPDDWQMAEMRRIQRLAAGEAPAADPEPAASLDERGFTNLQQQLAAEANAAEAVAAGAGPVEE
jgi:hypothetical protein